MIDKGGFFDLDGDVRSEGSLEVGVAPRGPPFFIGIECPIKMPVPLERNLLLLVRPFPRLLSIVQAVCSNRLPKRMNPASFRKIATAGQ